MVIYNILVPDFVLLFPHIFGNLGEHSKNGLKNLIHRARKTEESSKKST